MKGKYALVHTMANIGNRIHPIRVEVYLRRGIPGFQVIGLAGRNIRESKDRIRAAIESSGFEYPFQNITINLSPSSKKKEGSQFDLSIAVGILLASHQLNFKFYENVFLIGELALNGDILPVPQIAKLLSFHLPKQSTVLIPKINMEDSLIMNQEAKYIGVDRLYNLKDPEFINETSKSKIHFLGSDSLLGSKKKFSPSLGKDEILELYPGQKLAFDALVYALMGHHHILMTGVPGSGKSMLADLASRIQSIPNKEEWKEIYSMNQVDQTLNPNNPIRPFRIPHHSITANGLLGGGSKIQMGEISLAHRGILVLDEFGEIKTNLIQNLREPMDRGSIDLHRNSQWVEFPSRFQLIALSNLCPCGNFNSGNKFCICKKEQIRTYLSKISGPMLERFDIITEIHRLNQQLNESKEQRITIDLFSVKESIQKVREIQWERFKENTIYSNSEISSGEIYKYLLWGKHEIEVFHQKIKKFDLSFRERIKILRLARTVADSKLKQIVDEEDITFAMGLREGSKTIKFLAA